jgi:hypothetical protein
MRLFLFALFISSSAVACPDLAGVYSACRSTTSHMPAPQEIAVTQRNADKVNIYYLMTVDESGNKEVDTFTANGKNQPQEMRDPESGTSVSYDSKATCKGDALEIETTILNQKITISFTKKNQELIQQISTTNALIDTIICK